MSVASSAPGGDPVALVGPCVCPCRSVRQVRLMLIRVGGVGYRHPMLARLLVVGWVVLLRGPGAQMGPGGRSRRRARPLPQWCRAQPRRTRRRRRVCAGGGRRPGDTLRCWRGGVVLRCWCSSCSARSAPLSDRPRHTRCWRESSSILNQRLRPVRAAAPAAPLPLEVSARFLSPAPARGVVGVSRR